ncbi:MAG: ABC transporter permease [Chloroflexi bacterium]|nr:ABC transporter permease [Chloroflexota bacterium]
MTEQVALNLSPAVLIRPQRAWGDLGWHELWEYRELLYFLVWRDLKVRYKQTALGAAWAIIQPFFTMVVFSLFFGRLARVPSEGIPYPIFAYVALLPWTYVSSAIGQAANILVGSANLITKVYFPRVIMPAATVVAGLVDFAIAFVILIGMMIYYGIAPTWATVFLPAFLLLAVSTALGVGLWLSALNVVYRDISYAVPFLTQFWLFATPVAYPSSLLSEPWRTLYGLNPMVGVVEGFRWALLGAQFPGPLFGVSAVVSLLLLASGIIYFRSIEETFADVV